MEEHEKEYIDLGEDQEYEKVYIDIQARQLLYVAFHSKKTKDWEEFYIYAVEHNDCMFSRDEIFYQIRKLLDYLEKGGKMNDIYFDLVL